MPRIKQHPLPTPASDSRDLSAWRPPDAEFPWAPPGPFSGPSRAPGRPRLQRRRGGARNQSTHPAGDGAAGCSGSLASHPILRAVFLAPTFPALPRWGCQCRSSRSEISRGHEAAPTRRILEPRAQTDLGAGLGGFLGAVLS